MNSVKRSIRETKKEQYAAQRAANAAKVVQQRGARLAALPPLRARDISPRFNNQVGDHLRKVQEITNRSPTIVKAYQKVAPGQRRLDRLTESQERALRKEEENTVKEQKMIREFLISNFKLSLVRTD